MDIRVRNTKKTEKDFKDRYTSLSFPDAADILSDQIAEQMMMDGFVSSALFCRMRISVCTHILSYFRSLAIHRSAIFFKNDDLQDLANT